MSEPLKEDEFYGPYLTQFKCCECGHVFGDNEGDVAITCPACGKQLHTGNEEVGRCVYREDPRFRFDVCPTPVRWEPKAEEGER